MEGFRNQALWCLTSRVVRGCSLRRECPEADTAGGVSAMCPVFPVAEGEPLPPRPSQPMPPSNLLSVLSAVLGRGGMTAEVSSPGCAVVICESLGQLSPSRAPSCLPQALKAADALPSPESRWLSAWPWRSHHCWSSSLPTALRAHGFPAHTRLLQPVIPPAFPWLWWSQGKEPLLSRHLCDAQARCRSILP